MAYLILLIIALVIIYQLVMLIVKVVPFIFSALGIGLVVVLGIGFIIGVIRGIGNYYNVLSDVYEKRVGVAIGVALTVFWVVCIGLFGMPMVYEIIKQISMMKSMITG